MSDWYFSYPNVRILNDDILNTTKIPNDYVDLIITSPPYNLSINYNSYNDSMDYDQYLLLFEKWMQKLLLLTKSDGRMCLNIPLDKCKGGYHSVGADITCIAKKVGWKYKTTIIWNEGNLSKNSAWGTWMSAKAPHVIAPVELIVVLYKGEWKKKSGSLKSTITAQEFKEWTSGIWTFNGESKRKIGHPAPFPVELPYRCIKLFSYEDDIVLDPFAGSGTTLIAAMRTNRKSIGVDIEEQYCELAKNRVLNEKNQE